MKDKTKEELILELEARAKIAQEALLKPTENPGKSITEEELWNELKKLKGKIYEHNNE